MSRALTPNVLTPQDLEPNWRWEGKIPAWGHNSVDFERRIDHDRRQRHLHGGRAESRPHHHGNIHPLTANALDKALLGENAHQHPDPFALFRCR